MHTQYTQKNIPKILLLGHNGYLGSYIKKNIKCDILNNRPIYDTGIKYDFIFNCIGKPDLEYCELNPNETLYSNATIISNVKYLYPNSKIINFSSYYVYDSYGLCDEYSNVTRKYQYCQQKLLSEELNKDGINFRIGKLFGNHYKTQNKLTEHIIYNDNLEIDIMYFNPTSVQCIIKILNNFDFLNDQTGIFNLSNSGFTTHYEYANFILKHLNLNKKIKKLLRAPKTFDNYGKFLMSTKKIENFVQINSWEDDLYYYLDLIKGDLC